MSNIPFELPDLSGLSALPDDRVMQLQSHLALLRRRVDAAAAMVAGELAHRSRRELGYAGLAQRTGARTAEKLVQSLSGASGTEARSLVRVGGVMGGESPWLDAVIGSVERGDLSVAAADAIGVGLGMPSSNVASDDLHDAASLLVQRVGDQPPEKVLAAARAIRDALDASGVIERERALRERRYLKLIPQGDGMTRIIGLLDPESAALVVDAVDRVTAPRRGGPRFVDPREKARAERIESDSRTTEQIALDALVDMVRVSAGADNGTLFGTRAPSVRVHVKLSDLEARTGWGTIEGQSAAISMRSVERIACGTGTVPILFDGQQVIDVGRDQRLFTARQRIALAARDGGCRFLGCDRPPSWCEAHHIVPWSQNGSTTLAEGVLLCPHHHMLIHNNGWEVVRHGSDYRLKPPRSIDAQQELIDMPVHNRLTAG